MAYDDWIKFRKVLCVDGRVRKMSRELRTECGQVLGALVRLWCLADDLCDNDGLLKGYTMDDIDAHVELPGFCLAMPIDWLEVKGDELYLPSYQEHNGTTAKKRATDTKRKQVSRSCPQSVRNLSDKTRTKRGLDKSRVDKNNTPLPPTGGRVFDETLVKEIYEAYPKHVGEKKALAAIADALYWLAREQDDPVAYLRDMVARYASWAKSNIDARYIPKPENWFVERRWNDELEKRATPTVVYGQPSKQDVADYEREVAAVRAERQAKGLDVEATKGDFQCAATSQRTK